MSDHLGYLFAAYSIIFVAIFLYVVFIWRRQVALEAEVKTIEARVQSLTEGAPRVPESKERS